MKNFVRISELGGINIHLIDMSLRQYNELLGSKEPAPGGGSTAALTGVLAASLTMMVVSLSIGKKSFETLDENVKSNFMEEYNNIKNLREDLYALTEEDTKAFNRFMEAMKLPKDTEEEKIIRNTKMQEASLYALNIPLITGEKCYSILKNQKNIAIYGNKNAVSDIGVGCLLALAGLEGAILNVNINLPTIVDITIKNDAIDKSRKMLEEARILHKEIMSTVNKRIG